MEVSNLKREYSFLQAGGEMGALTRSYNWAQTSIGSIDQWPQSLRTTLGIVLHSAFPMFLFWGDELLCFYNDAFRPSLGNEGKHPALGKPGKLVWPEIWAFIGPLIEKVKTTGEPVWYKNQLVPFYRNGKLENIYWTFSYSPAYGDSGKINGVFVTCTETTREVDAMQQLRASTSRFNDLIEQSPVACCLFTGRDMVIEVANPTMIGYWGKGNSVIGKPLREALPELIGQPFLQILDEVFTTGEAYEAKDARAELIVNGVPGIYYFDFTYKAIRNEYGEIYGVMDTAVDVTEKVLAQRKIEEADEKVQMAIQSAKLGTYEINLITGKIITSERMNEIWGLDHPISRAQFIDAIHPDDQQARLEANQQAAQNGSLVYEARVVWKDGSQHWVRLSGKVLYDDKGQAITLIGVVQDISELKFFAEELKKQVSARTKELENAQISLQVANQYLQRIINQFESALASLIPVYEGNKIVDFYFKMTNLAYQAYSNLAPDKIQNKKVSDVFPGYFQTDAFEKYIETFETGKTNQWELHYNLDGLDVYLQVIASKMEQEVVINFSDVTTLKTLQLDLLQKVKELERSNEELQQFAHVASHDLKEPVRKIKTFGSRLMMDFGHELPEKARLYMQKMEKATDRIYNMIDGVLLYSSLNITDQPIDCVDVNKLIQNICDDLEILIQQKEAVIRWKDLPTLEGSPLLLYQLFYNLVNNALKFAKANVAPVIEISAELVSSTSNGEFAIIRVQDNGIGFDQKFADAIFKTFVRLNTKDQYEGTGLGLALCQKIAERFGGAIQAEGKEGEGAVFSVLLPMIQTCTKTILLG